MNKFYIIPNNKDVSNINDDLILPLDNYSIGFDVYFTIDEINNISNNRKVSVVINKLFHKDLLNEFIKIKDKLNNIEYFFIEDFGLSNILDKNKVVLMGSHIINNYSSINYFKELGLSNVIVNNELTKEELIDIRKNTSSNLFYILISRNMLMYSKRPLLSSYYDYKNISNRNMNTIIKEVSTKKELIIKEENRNTCIFDNNIFSGNLYIKELNGYNFIVNLSNMNQDETNIILNHYKDNNLNDYINTDHYFLDNKIIYKLGVKE